MVAINSRYVFYICSESGDGLLLQCCNKGPSPDSVEKLIPESQNGEHSNIGTIGVALGFVLMMILDVALS